MSAGLPLTVTLELTDEQLRQVAERVAVINASAKPPHADPWLATRAAAEHLGCPVGRIHDLVQLGHLQPHRDGRRLVFRRSALDAYIESGS